MTTLPLKYLIAKRKKNNEVRQESIYIYLRIHWQKRGAYERMFKFRKVTSLFLIAILLLTGAIGTVHATNNTEPEEKNITKEEVKNTNEDIGLSTEKVDKSETSNKESSKSTDTSPDESRSGNLTKDSKYPFYDEVGVLSEETKNIILNMNKNFEKEGAQIGVVVLNSLGGNSVEEKANKIFNTWGLGSKERNDGALLLISITDRKFRLEVGNGLRNTVLSDYEAKEIIDKMIPYFKKEAYDLGINVALFEIDQKFYQYRDYLSESNKGKEIRKASEVATVSENNNNSKNVSKERPRAYRYTTGSIFDEPNSYPDNSLDFDEYMPVIKRTAFILFFLIFIGRLLFEIISANREEKCRAEEEEERVRAFGAMHEVIVEIKDQHGKKAFFECSDYSKKKIDKEKVLNTVKAKVLSEGCFGYNVIDYEIENIEPSINYMKFGDTKYIKITIKTVNEEVNFKKDKDRVQVTKDFYNSLEIEERERYMSRANADMRKDGGSDVWFYLYLYMLLKSDKSDNFRTSMSRANIANDRFYKAPDVNQNTSASYDDSDSSSDFIDTFNTLNSLNSTFGGDNSSGSSFGGFGGGSSSGGGASGGW